MSRYAVLALLAACASDPAGPVTPTPVAPADEQALLGELDRKQYIPARERAEALLAAHGESFVATWAMALVHHYEEGNHARALYFVRRAGALLEPTAPPERTKQVLLEEVLILGEMDRVADQLAAIDRHAERFPPGRGVLRIWPLLKLRRYDEARATAHAHIASDDADDRRAAYNGMIAIEAELHNRAEAYEAAARAIAAFPESCTLIRNAAIVAVMRFRHREMESLLLRSLATRDTDCSSRPYAELARFYLGAGDLQKAAATLRDGAGKAIEKQYRPHHAMENRTMLADLMLALGKPVDAERVAAEVYEQPERTGMTSTSVRRAQLVRAFRYWFALDGRIAYERERASYRSIGSSATIRTRLVLARWEVRRIVLQLSADPDALLTMARPHIEDVGLPRWMISGIVDAVGPGVVATALADARAIDRGIAEAEPHFDALAGQIAFRTGDLSNAIALATKALAGLPAEESLVRWYTMAWLADAQRRLGEHDAATASYREVLEKFPTAVRLLDLAVPATISDDGSELARDAAARLHDSARFTADPRGFRLEVGAKAPGLSICLLDPGGFQLACAGGATVEAALDAFHDAAFSPRVSVTERDLNSLDGAPSSRSADQVLEGVLKP